MADARRRALAQARGAARDALDRWRKHTGGCYLCHHAERTQDTVRYCDTGWQLAKIVSRTACGVARLEDTSAVDWYGKQGALF